MAIRYILEIGNPVTHRFSTAVRNEINPTDATYPDSLGNSILYPVRLAIPSVNNKISDAISGASTLLQYNLVIENSDGKYDDVVSLGWFNTIAVLKRCDKENPLLEDFNIIMQGEISYPIVTQNTVQLAVDNTFRALTQQVCKTFNTTEYPNVFDNVKDKPVPIGYGDLKNVPLYRVDPSEYIALDEDYITAVSAVYDIDGNSISFTFNPTTKRIGAIDATTADVTGRTNNKIGSIITTEIEEKSLITYNSNNWDIEETNRFILNDVLVNFYFSGGSVRDLINSVLKNDIAFLFTKNNGKFTLRRWGRTYTQHNIPSWKFMKFPKRDYKDYARFFNSSVVIQYNRSISTGIYNNQLLLNNDSLHVKPKRAIYPVDLFDLGDINDLANRLYDRFSLQSEKMPFYIGMSTENINLLDTVVLDVNINGRQFAKKTTWIVREVDPGQDVLMLEAILSAQELGIIDGILSQSYNQGYDGTLSQPYNQGYDSVLSQPLSVVI